MAGAPGRQGRIREWLWRSFASMAALLVVAAALMPSDADSPGAVIVRLLGAAILVTIVYSYLMSLRRS